MWGISFNNVVSLVFLAILGIYFRGETDAANVNLALHLFTEFKAELFYEYLFYVDVLLGVLFQEYWVSSIVGTNKEHFSTFAHAQRTLWLVMSLDTEVITDFPAAILNFFNEHMKIQIPIREAFKHYLADFFRKGCTP